LYKRPTTTTFVVKNLTYVFIFSRKCRRSMVSRVPTKLKLSFGWVEMCIIQIKYSKLCTRKLILWDMICRIKIFKQYDKAYCPWGDTFIIKSNMPRARREVPSNLTVWHSSLIMFLFVPFLVLLVLLILLFLPPPQIFFFHVISLHRINNS
jgi:hypothetical protein